MATRKKEHPSSFVSKMAGQLALRQLLDNALGNPNKSTVDLGLLKDFLLQFLIATNQCHFIVNSNGKSVGLSKDRSKVVEKTNQNAGPILIENHDSEVNNQDEKESEEIRSSNIQETLETGVVKSHEDTVSGSLQPLDRLPSGAKLLENRQDEVKQMIEAKKSGDRPAVVAGDANIIAANEVGEKSQNYLSNSWNTVRVNKRLQALEDGVDKLFSMLDILTAGQNELRNRKDTPAFDLEELKKLREDVAQLGGPKGEVEVGRSDINQLKGNFDKEVLDLKSRLESIEALVDRLDGIEGKVAALLERNAKLEERLGGLEIANCGTTEKEEIIPEVPEKREEMDIDELKKALLDIENLKNNNKQEDIENMTKSIADDVYKIQEKLDGFVTRLEIADVVRWPQLEDALNVKAFAESKQKMDSATSKDVIEMKKMEVSVDMGPVTEDVGEKEEEKSKEEEKMKEEENSKEEHEEEAELGKKQESIVIEKSSEFERNESPSPCQPSPELRECLQRIGDLSMTFGEFETKVATAIAEGDRREQKIDEIKKDVEDLNDITSSVNQVADGNKTMIDRMMADFGVHTEECDLGKTDGRDEQLTALKEHVDQLESRGNRTSLALNDLNTSLFNELRGKQNLIDALFECVDGLQRNKVDIDKAKSIFDLDAYKDALDSKVNMNQFDEMMMELNANLQDVFQKLDKYASEEESLKDALNQMSLNMKDKLDAKAEKSLKKYLESRIAQLKKSRENLVSRAGRDIITNAAGFRRPLNTLFHCISCDRPVHLDGYEDYNGNCQQRKDIGNRDLGKNGSLASVSLDAIHGNKASNRGMWRDPFVVERYCGGNYTAFMQNPKKQVKTNPELPPNAKGLLDRRKREKTIVKYLLGTDGQVYRGRYKMTDLGRTQYQSEFGGRLRSRSAETGRPSIDDQHHVIGTMSNPPSLLSSPRNLPPLGQDVLGVKTTQLTDRYDMLREKSPPSNGESKT